MQYPTLKTSEQNIFQKKISHNNFVFAYPTEAVYGLGANPFDESAVKRILTIKNRSAHQHFILIAANWEQILPWIKPLDEQTLAMVQATWPGPVTWVFPASELVPSWLLGENKTIALRMTAHPIAKSLCEIASHPLISTSANLSGEPPCRTYEETQRTLGHQLDLIISGDTGGLSQPTPIRDVSTGEFLRF